MPSLDEMTAADYVSPEWDGDQQQAANAARPPGHPFRHSHDCKNRGKFEPAWQPRHGGGHVRSCECGSEVSAPRPGPPPKPGDNHPALRSFKAEHDVHGPIKLAFHDDGYWFVECPSCRTKRPFVQEALDHHDTGRPMDLSEDRSDTGRGRLEISLPKFTQHNGGRPFVTPPRPVGE